MGREKPTRPIRGAAYIYVAGNNKVRPACRAKIISDLFPPRLPHAISLLSPGGCARQIWSRIISRLRVAQPSQLDQLCARTFVLATSRVANQPAQPTRRDTFDAFHSQRSEARTNLIRNYVLMELTVYAGPTIAHLDLFHQDFAC